MKLIVKVFTKYLKSTDFIDILLSEDELVVELSSELSESELCNTSNSSSNKHKLALKLRVSEVMNQIIKGIILDIKSILFCLQFYIPTDNDITVDHISKELISLRKNKGRQFSIYNKNSSKKSNYYIEIPSSSSSNY